jgi:hypothetical protein
MSLDLDPDDADLIALLKNTPRPAPTLADTNRLARGLDDAIAREQEARRRRISPGWALLAVVAAASASAGAALWLHPSVPAHLPAHPLHSGSVMAPETGTTTTTTTTTTPVAVVVVPAVVGSAVVEPMLETVAVAVVDDADVVPRKPKKPAPHLSHGPRSWQARAEDLVTRAQLVPAARLYAAAVVDSDDPRGAALSLRGLAGRDPAVIDTLDPLVPAIDDDEVLARVLRLSCELRLRHRRDAAAVDACRVFGQRFPAHPAARALAFGAGGLAEELGDLRAAIEEYTRSIVLAPLLGASSNDALLGRARVRTRLGELDEARADLRVYLQQEHRPAETHDDEVQGLARALKVDLP